MPQRREVDGIGVVVRGKIECCRAHAEERAEREIDDRADNRRLVGRAGHHGIDALVKPLISPETSRMTKVEPTKNHGRRLNVSHPKRMAAPEENPMTAR